MTERMSMVIADIGGYTRFMQQYRFALAHAQELIGELLEAVIDGAKPFQLAKLEGDAAFLYAPADKVSPKDLWRVVDRVRGKFLTTRAALIEDRMCTCDACMNINLLTLKFVAHEGDVAFQKVKRHRELAGVDVILLHRMLKNDVPVREYVLTTQTPEHLEEPLRQRSQRLEHDFEGIGATTTHYVDFSDLPPESLTKVEPNGWRKFVRKVGFELGSLPYVIGLKKPCSEFRNVEFGPTSETAARPPA